MQVAFDGNIAAGQYWVQYSDETETNILILI